MMRALALAAVAVPCWAHLRSEWVGPQWLVFLITLALAKAVVVRGILPLKRTGPVATPHLSLAGPAARRSAAPRSRYSYVRQVWLRQ
jgi:hypothetical protein